MSLQLTKWETKYSSSWVRWFLLPRPRIFSTLCTQTKVTSPHVFSEQSARHVCYRVKTELLVGPSKTYFSGLLIQLRGSPSSQRTSLNHQHYFIINLLLPDVQKSLFPVVMQRRAVSEATLWAEWESVNISFVICSFWLMQLVYTSPSII